MRVCVSACVCVCDGNGILYLISVIHVSYNNWGRGH